MKQKDKTLHQPKSPTHKPEPDKVVKGDLHKQDVLPEILNKDKLWQLAPAQRQEALLRLQGQQGNYAIQQLLNGNSATASANVVIQHKLTVNEPNDVYEQEANRVAEQVVQRLQQSPEATANPAVIQCKEGNSTGTSTGQNLVSPAIETRIEQVRGQGNPLPDGMRHQMEEAFQADFTQVRIHTDGVAHELAQTLDARAFATGQDVFFREGEYAPNSLVGQELLAHELVHTIQQAQNVQRKSAPDKNKTQTEIKVVRAEKGHWITFNRPLFWNEVADYLWEGKIKPETYHLRSKNGSETDLIGNETWQIAIFSGFLESDKGLYRLLRPDVRQLIESAENQLSLESALEHVGSLPKWIPVEEWIHFMSTKQETWRRLSKAGPIGTDIILVKQDGSFIGAYDEAPTDTGYLFELLGTLPPTTLQRLLGAEKPEQAHVRWLAKANEGFNRYMFESVIAGISPSEAYQKYPDAVLTALLVAFSKILGFGSGWSTNLGGAVKEYLEKE